jgi:hypothetical protein
MKICELKEPIIKSASFPNLWWWEAREVETGRQLNICISEEEIVENVSLYFVNSFNNIVQPFTLTEEMIYRDQHPEYFV